MEDGKFRAEESAGWCFTSPGCFVNTLAYHSEFANPVLNLYRYLKAGSVMASQVDIVKTIKGGERKWSFGHRSGTKNAPQLALLL
jgi:hypothetical protein